MAQGPQTPAARRLEHSQAKRPTNLTIKIPKIKHRPVEQLHHVTHIISDQVPTESGTLESFEQYSPSTRRQHEREYNIGAMESEGDWAGRNDYLHWYTKHPTMYPIGRNARCPCEHTKGQPIEWFGKKQAFRKAASRQGAGTSKTWRAPTPVPGKVSRLEDKTSRRSTKGRSSPPSMTDEQWIMMLEELRLKYPSWFGEDGDVVEPPAMSDAPKPEAKPESKPLPEPTPGRLPVPGPAVDAAAAAASSELTFFQRFTPLPPQQLLKVAASAGVDLSDWDAPTVVVEDSWSVYEGESLDMPKTVVCVAPCLAILLVFAMTM